MSQCVHCVHMYMLRSLCWVTYCISSIRCHGYYLFAAHFVRLLYEGSVYFFGKPRDINDGWIRCIWVRQWQLLDTVSSTCSLSLLLSAVGTTCTTQTVLALARWWSSEIICTCVHVLRVLAAAIYYLRAVFISFKIFGSCGYYSRAAIIRGWHLFEVIWHLDTKLTPRHCKMCDK